MKSAVAFLLVLAAVCNAIPLAAQSALPRIDLREALNRGATISVELTDGRCVTGQIGDRWNDGFWIEHAPGPSVFVRYDTVLLLRDPITGAATARVSPIVVDEARRWMVPALIGAGVIVVITVATRGLFPLCLFEKCLR